MSKVTITKQYSKNQQQARIYTQPNITSLEYLNTLYEIAQQDFPYTDIAEKDVTILQTPFGIQFKAITDAMPNDYDSVTTF